MSSGLTGCEGTAEGHCIDLWDELKFRKFKYCSLQVSLASFHISCTGFKEHDVEVMLFFQTSQDLCKDTERTNPAQVPNEPNLYVACEQLQNWKT